MRVLSVAGARPQFIKLAPMCWALAEAGHEHVVVHTGQHYDYGMSDVFFSELGIPQPDVNLGVGSGTHAFQTARMMEGLEAVLQEQRPDWVLVYGDTNSTLAGAITAAKLLLPLAHLEAGLRSGNRDMPEELNRVLTDHAADLLLAPTENAMHSLAEENLAGRAVLVGDVMVDVCLKMRDSQAGGNAELFPSLGGAPYLLATIHRAENTSSRDRLDAILTGLSNAGIPVVLAAHPRLMAAARDFGLDPAGYPGITIVEPLPYTQLIRAVLGSRGVVTDSGGLQKETYLLHRMCTTVRHETEWTETLENGWNVLVPDPSRLHEAVTRPQPATPPDERVYGDGQAAGRAVAALAGHSR